MILLHCPRRTPLTRHVTKNPSPQPLFFLTLTNCDARNPFRIRFYENCRVSPARSLKNLAFFSSSPVVGHALLPTPALSPLVATLMNLDVSVANKRLTESTKPFRCNTYEKRGGTPCLLSTTPLTSQTLAVHRRHPHPLRPTARSIPAKRPRANGSFSVSGCLPAPRRGPL